MPNLDLPCLMDPRDPRMTKNACFLLLTHTKQHFFFDFCDTNAGTQKYDRTDAGCCHKDGQIGILKYSVM